MKDNHTAVGTQKKCDTVALLRYGFSIIPLHSWDAPKSQADPSKRGKTPVIKNWTPYKTRRATEAELAQWLERFPRSNWAIITGHISGIVVLDIDDVATAQEFIARNGGLPDTPCVRTARGMHHYFMHPGGTIRNAAGKYGCDLRGDGGYVVAPGSIHGTGAMYEWLVTPDETSFAELPKWVVDAMEKNGEPRKERRTKPAPAKIGSTPYGHAAMQGECDAIRATPEGGRNHQLNVSSFNLGRLIAGGELDRHEGEEALHDAARACGLADTEPQETRRTMKSGLEDGMTHPRTAPEKPIQPTNGGTKDDKKTTSSLFKFTDMGNGERFAERNRGKILYDYTSRSWLTWDGTRWTRDVGGVIWDLAKSTVRAIVRELELASDEEQRTAILKHAIYSEREGNRNAMLAMAQSELPTHQGELDSHPELFNLQNGTLDLETLVLREHDPNNKLTKISPVSFDPSATCPKWIAFLNRIFEDSEELIQFVQQMCGYMTTTNISEQCFFLLHGIGANGKSTFVNTILHVMGDYGIESHFNTFTHSDRTKWELADFKGVRLVAASEGERGQRLAESMMKNITGGEKLTAERKRGHPFRFSPEFKLLLSTNHKPRITGTDYAIWRRVRFIPFNVTISDEEKNPTLLNELKREASGILNWMLQGLDSWNEKGLILAESVQTATALYRNEQDTLGPFIDECCTIGTNERATLSDLYAGYKQYSEKAGERLITRRAFGERLTERGYEKYRGTGNAVAFFGLSVRVTEVT